jgi:hypothetical protein
MFYGTLKWAVPQTICSTYIDARNVAKAQVIALNKSEINGKRLLTSTGFLLQKS